MINYYVFYINNGYNIYERTCGTKEATENRVVELKKIYDDAEYFENESYRNCGLMKKHRSITGSIKDALKRSQNPA